MKENISNKQAMIIIIKPKNRIFMCSNTIIIISHNHRKIQIHHMNQKENLNQSRFNQAGKYHTGALPQRISKNHFDANKTLENAPKRKGMTVTFDKSFL